MSLKMSKEEVKALRLRLGKTQEEFALMIGVSSGAVSRYERHDVKKQKNALLKMKELSEGLKDER